MAGKRKELADMMGKKEGRYILCVGYQAEGKQGQEHRRWIQAVLQ